MNLSGTGGPSVTVGLTVFNEEQYVEEAIESILEQDFDDLEILIGDNASEDRTAEIALRYSQQDPRIRHVRHARNVGFIENYNRLVKEASGSYFVLSGGHDRWSKNFLTDLKRALDQNPEAVLAYAPTEWIGPNGEALDRKTGYVDTSGYGPLARFNIMMWADQHALYGMYRVDALRSTRLQLEFIGSGAVLLGELALLGSTTVVPDARWYRRQNREVETLDQRTQRYHQMLFSKPRRPLLPYWRLPIAYATAVLHWQGPLGLRMVLLVSAMNSLIRYRSELWCDLVRLPRRLANYLTT